MTILEEIIAYKRKFVNERKELVSIQQLETSEYFHKPTRSLKKAIEEKRGKAIIAEYKRRSPSKGIINNKSDVVTVVRGYEKAGAAGISILTDEAYFGGSDNDLYRSRSFCSIPILRKDFIVDEYQIIEARSIGADVILLIASCLSENELKRLFEYASSFQLEVLFEIHNADEISKLPPDAQLIGVNNRNLNNFVVNIDHSNELAYMLPKGCIKIVESGIDSPDTVKLLANNGFDAFLIGENFMKNPFPEQSCRSFIQMLES